MAISAASFYELTRSGLRGIESRHMKGGIGYERYAVGYPDPLWPYQQQSQAYQEAFAIARKAIDDRLYSDRAVSQLASVRATTVQEPIKAEATIDPNAPRLLDLDGEHEIRAPAITSRALDL